MPSFRAKSKDMLLDLLLESMRIGVRNNRSFHSGHIHKRSIKLFQKL
ncbi:unnamed protein product [Cylicostephanus goldi]|uniref:Uncharacterized protein n=1 Tax=Cylicostephanus goldi TaxID=71465 RepID=A0A3P6U0B8_CYLGO|nr:unnamed protein product [Cylicostephanus goldi]